jgi:hypothetical protein
MPATHYNPDTGETYEYKDDKWVSYPPNWHDTLTKDVPTAVKTGFLHRVVPSIFGFPGDAQAAGEWLGGKLDKLMGTEVSEETKRKAVPHFPTSAEVSDAIGSVSPDVKPATETGKITKNVTGFGGTLIGSPMNTVKNAATSIARNVVGPGVLSQVASDVVGKYARDPRASAAAYIAGGGLLPGMAGLRSTLTPAQLAAAKSKIGDAAAVAGAPAVSYALGMPAHELLLQGYLGKAVGDIFPGLKAIPGKVLLGGSKATPGDAASMVRALQQGTWNEDDSPAPQ